MKRAHLAPAAAIAFGLSLLVSTAATASPAPQLGKGNPKNLPKVNKTVTPQKKKSASQDPTDLAKNTTSTGVIKSIRVGKSGAIDEINIKLAGNTRTARIVGCGAKSADHPLLNWAFQSKRLVYIHADGNACFSHVIVTQ